MFWFILAAYLIQISLNLLFCDISGNSLQCNWVVSNSLCFLLDFLNFLHFHMLHPEISEHEQKNHDKSKPNLPYQQIAIVLNYSQVNFWTKTDRDCVSEKILTFILFPNFWASNVSCEWKNTEIWFVGRSMDSRLARVEEWCCTRSMAHWRRVLRDWPLP